MGDRGQILIRDTGVYLYTHCGRHKLIQDVKTALSNKQDRWKDPGTMTSIIASQMDCDSITNHFVYNYLLIVIDFKYDKVEIVEYPDSRQQKIIKIDSLNEFLDYKEEE